MDPWIPVYVQIGLGILTFAGSGVMVHWLNSRKENKEFLRTKLEALFLATGEFQQLCLTVMHPWAQVITGEMSFEEASAACDEASKNKPEYFETVEMLVRLYFPKLIPEFERCEESSSKVNVLMFKIRRASREKNSLAIESLVNPYLEALKNFDGALDGLKEAITRLGEEVGLLALHHRTKAVTYTCY
jgi:hypothetical protein